MSKSTCLGVTACVRDLSWSGERYRRSFWFIQVGPEEEEIREGEGAEMVAEDDASVISTSSVVSDAGIAAITVGVSGSEVGVATAAVADVEACVIPDAPRGTV